MVQHKTVEMQFNVLTRAIAKEYKLDEPGNLCPPEITSGLDLIEAEVEKLKDTWSVMAGKNIMADVVRLVAALEPRLKPASRDAAIAVKKNITGIMGGYSPSKARYQSVLCLGYKVTTVSKAFSGEASDRADLEKKADELLKAIKAAHSGTSKHHGEDSMLKIFMAPEFYFRGARGGYDADDVNGTKGGKQGLIQILRAELDKDQYKNWLFVLGTVIVISKDMKTACTQCNAPVKFVPIGGGKTKPTCSGDANHAVAEKATGAHVDNVALILKEKSVHSVAKELVSDVDYKLTDTEPHTVLIDNQKVAVNRHDTDSSGYKAGDKGPTKFQDERMGGCIFTIDGLTFGCEVCLDHAASGKSDVIGVRSDGSIGPVAYAPGRLDGADNIQISLIPSGGMSVTAFRTVPNGVIFNVDGETPHVQVMGLSTKKQKLTFARSDKRANGTAIDEAFTAKTWTDMTNWVMKLAYGPNEAVGAPIAAPSGPVLQFGPFQIPSTV